MARTEPGPARRGGELGELVRATRPRQWSKNLLVFAAPLLSGRFTEIAVLADAVVAFVAFTLAAAGIYLVNDVRDVESDRLHPVKRLRPVAAGTLGARTAVWASAVLSVAALLVALISGPALVTVVAIYLAISLALLPRAQGRAGDRHRHHRERVPPAGDRRRRGRRDRALAVVPARRVLRLPLHGRRQEVRRDPAGGRRRAGSARPSLASYTPSYLRFVWTVSAGLLIMTYGLWAFELGEAAGGSWWYVASMAPFVLAVLRYALDVDRGTAGEPEELALQGPDAGDASRGAGWSWWPSPSTRARTGHSSRLASRTSPCARGSVDGCSRLGVVAPLEEPVVGVAQHLLVGPAGTPAQLVAGRAHVEPHRLSVHDPVVGREGAQVRGTR